MSKDEIPEHELTPHFFHKRLKDHDGQLERVEKKVGINVDGEEKGEFVTKAYFREFVLPDIKIIKDGNNRTQLMIGGTIIAGALLLWLMHMGIIRIG